MADEKEAPPGAVAADPSQGTVIRVAKIEEGSTKGEFWAVLRAVLVLFLVILVLGYIVG